MGSKPVSSESTLPTGSKDTPQELRVSPKPILHETEAEADWKARWETLARQVSDAWQSANSAVEALSEMRR